MELKCLITYQYKSCSQSKFFGGEGGRGCKRVSMRNLWIRCPLGFLGSLKAPDCLIASHTQSQLHLLVMHPR